MATLEEMFGRTELLTPQARQRAIEAGINTPEDFGGRSAKVAPTEPSYKSGSSAPSDAAAARGLSIEQLRAIQDAKLQELLRKRKAAGYAGGGEVKPKYTGTTPRESNPWIRNLKALNPFEAYDPTVEQEPLFEQEAATYDERMARAQSRLNEFAADMVLDPLNLVGGAVMGKLLKGVGAVGKKALAPTSMAVGSAAYGSDAEAGELGALGRIARKLAGPAERKLSIVRDVPLHAPGPAVSAKSYEVSDLGALMDALEPYTKPRMLKKPDGDSIFGQAIDNISDPDGPNDALTTVLFGADGAPQAYHQVSPKGGAMSDADYLAFLGSISGQKGAGEQALRHSLDNSSGEMSFYPTPGAKPFYDKMMTRIPGMRKVQGDGNNVGSMSWSRENKAGGGMIGALGRIAKNLSGEVAPYGVAWPISSRSVAVSGFPATKRQSLITCPTCKTL